MNNCQNCNKSTPNPKFCCLSCSCKYNSKIKSEIQKQKTISNYYKNPKHCRNCNEIISYTKDVNNKKFCSHSCSAIFHNNIRITSGWGRTSETKEKMLLKSALRKKLKKSSFTKISWAICNFTGKPYMSTPIIKNGNIIKGRRQRSPYIDISIKEEYYRRSQFKFNVYHYPEKFDLSMIEKYGWYSTPGTRKNGIKNTDGISRDHMYSIMDGFINKIDPEIISHPANCQLLQHTENIRKHRKSIISYEELLDRIDNW